MPFKSPRKISVSALVEYSSTIFLILNFSLLSRDIIVKVHIAKDKEKNLLNNLKEKDYLQRNKTGNRFHININRRQKTVKPYI